MCTDKQVEAMLQVGDRELSEFMDDAIREEEEALSDGAADTLCSAGVRDEWRTRSVFDPGTNSKVDKMTVAKWINKNIPLTISKSSDRIRRVASLGKYSKQKNEEATSAIGRAYRHGISAIDLPEGESFMKHGDYAMMLVEAQSKKASKETRRFGVIVRLLAFGPKKGALVERVWNAEESECFVLVEMVKIEAGLNAVGQQALKICDEAGEQFKNISGRSISLVTPYSHIEGQGGDTNPKISWMFVKKEIDDAFDALTASPEYVSLKKKHLLSQ